MSTARLPNPNLSHQESSALSLREALGHQQSTAIWSRNTDINTFKGMVTNKKNLEGIRKDGMAGITAEFLQDQNEEKRNEEGKVIKTLGQSIFSALDIFKSPLEKLTETLNGIKFSDFADSFAAGSNRIKSGMKELTNGMGAFGPIINGLKTALYKAAAVFNVIAGTLQMVLGIIPKIFSRLFEKKRDQDDDDLDKLNDKLEQLTQQRDGDTTEHAKKMEALMVKLHPDSINAIDSMINGSSGTRSSATYFDDYRLEEEQRQYNEKQKEYDKEIFELEEKRQKKLARKDRMNSMFTFAKYGLIVAAIFAVIILLRDKIGTLFTSIFDSLKANGYFGAIGNAASTFATRTGQLFDELAKGLRNMLGKGNAANPNLGASNKPTVTSSAASGSKLVVGNSPAGLLDSKGNLIKYAETPVNPASTGNPAGPPKPPGLKVTGVLKSIGNTLKTIGPMVAKGGAIGEAAFDLVLNEKKYGEIVSAFEKGLPVPQPDGSMSPITQEQMDGIQAIMNNNRVGSAGRGTGAFYGGATAATLTAAKLSPMLAGGPLSWLGYGLAVTGMGVAGAMGGGYVGDNVATEGMEYLTGTDNSQELLNGLGANAKTANDLKEAIDSGQYALDEQRAVANSNVIMDSSTRNFIKQEAMFHGATVPKKDVMLTNSFLHKGSAFNF